MEFLQVISQISSFLSLLIGGGAIWKLVDMGRQNGRMEQRILTLETRTTEDRQKDSAKFDKLYNSRNESTERIIRIETKLDIVLEKIESANIISGKKKKGDKC